MGTEIRVTKTFGGDYWLLFDEADVRKACTLAKCDSDMIEDCIADMKEGEHDCTTCYIYLMNDVRAVPKYLKVQNNVAVQSGRESER